MDLLAKKKEVVKVLYKNKILVTKDIIKLMDSPNFIESIPSIILY